MPRILPVLALLCFCTAPALAQPLPYDRGVGDLVCGPAPAGGLCLNFLFGCSAFFAHNPAADFNASGAIDSQDLFDFLGSFFAGG